MQRWDYACVQIIKSYGVKYRFNGNNVSDWNDIPLFQMLQNMGEKGYEMIGIDGENYIFKRPGAASPTNAGRSPFRENQPQDIVAKSGLTAQLKNL